MMPPANTGNRVIALCVNSAWNVVNFRAGLVRSLIADGYRVVVIAPSDHPLAALEALGCTFVAVEMDRGSLSPVHDARLFFTLRRVLRKIRPAALLAYTIKPNVYAGLAAQTLGIPVINNIAGFGTMFLRGRLAAWLASALYRIALRRSRVVFFQNPDDRVAFVRARIVTSAQAYLLPGSGIDLARFAPLPLPEGDGGLVFLMIARLLRDKGVEEYANAAARVCKDHPGVRFLLVGVHDPSNKAAIDPASVVAWQTAGVLEYRGSLDDVRPVLAEADCVVLPSYREGLPRTLLEGGAMGRPLIATDVPGSREVVKDGVNGYLCRVADSGALADAVLRMISVGPHERKRMGLAARTMIEERFDEQLVVKAYLSALADAHDASSGDRRVAEFIPP